MAGPAARRARQRLAPTGVGCRITDRGFGRHDPVVPCRPVGVRRCLTRPARQGRQSPGGAMGMVVSRSARWSMHATRFAAPGARRARQRLAPTGVGCRITDRGFGPHDPVVPCRPVGVRRCLTRRPARAGEWHRRPGTDARSRRGWAPAVRPGLKPRAESPSPLKGAVRRPGARVDRLRRWDQPASAGLGTEPGRSRPGDRGYGRSADPRCVSCETCRPRGIAAPSARRARQRLAPTGVGWHHRGGGRRAMVA
jgi:hypothetical protein